MLVAHLAGSAWRNEAGAIKSLLDPLFTRVREKPSEKGRSTLQRSHLNLPKALFMLRIPGKTTLVALFVPLFGQSRKGYSPKSASRIPHNHVPKGENTYPKTLLRAQPGHNIWATRIKVLPAGCRESRAAPLVLRQLVGLAWLECERDRRPAVRSNYSPERHPRRCLSLRGPTRRRYRQRARWLFWAPLSGAYELLQPRFH